MTHFMPTSLARSDWPTPSTPAPAEVLEAAAARRHIPVVPVPPPLLLLPAAAAA